MPVDYDNDQALIMRLNEPQHRRQAEHTLQALCQAVCFDGRIDDSEIEMMRQFLVANSCYASTWPFDRVWSMFESVLTDGVVTLDERMQVLRLLREFQTVNPGDAPERGKATEAIFDDDAEIVIPGHSFVITGVLEHSKRTPFQNRLAALGGVIHDNVRLDTAYVVVGLKGSEAWTTSRYGSKIARAMELKKDQGSTLKVVREFLAIEALIAREAGIPS